MATTTQAPATINAAVIGKNNSPQISVLGTFGNQVSVMVYDPSEGALTDKDVSYYDKDLEKVLPVVYKCPIVPAKGYKIDLTLDLIPSGDPTTQVIAAQVTIDQMPDEGDQPVQIGNGFFQFAVTAPATPDDDSIQPVTVVFS